MAIRLRRTAIRQRSIGVSDRLQRRGAGEIGGRRRVMRRHLTSALVRGRPRATCLDPNRRREERSARSVVCQRRPVGLDDRMLPGLADEARQVRPRPKLTSPADPVPAGSPFAGPRVVGPTLAKRSRHAGLRRRRAQVHCVHEPMNTGSTALSRWRACVSHARGHRPETRAHAHGAELWIMSADDVAQEAAERFAAA